MKFRIAIIFIFISLLGHSQTTKISVENARTDLSSMFQTIKSVHYNPYSTTSESEYLAQRDTIFKSWNEDSISIREFTRSGMKLAAKLSMGHTSFNWQNPAVFPALSQHKFIPFKVTLKNNQLIVTASATDQLTPGDTVRFINNQPAIDVFREIMSYTGGIEAFKISVSEQLFPLYLFFNATINDTYEIELASGSRKLITSTLNVSEVSNFMFSDNPHSDYTFDIIENNIGLISYNSCNDYDAFKHFLDSTFSKIREEKIQHVIIDIRANGGGNSSLNDLLLSYLTRKKYRQSSGRFWKVSTEVQSKIKVDSLWREFLDESFLNDYLNADDQSIIDERDLELTKNRKPQDYFKGKHCFLIGPNTFSSANFLADAVKTFKLSTLIGQSTGELTNDFGELVEFQLPISGSYFFVPSTFDIGTDNNLESMKPVEPTIRTDEDALHYATEWILTTKR